MLWFYESFFPVVWVFFFLRWQIKATNTKATQRLESELNQPEELNLEINSRFRSSNGQTGQNPALQMK
jgi:hypothetical protein